MDEVVADQRELLQNVLLHSGHAAQEEDSKDAGGGSECAQQGSAGRCQPCPRTSVLSFLLSQAFSRVDAEDVRADLVTALLSVPNHAQADTPLPRTRVRICFGRSCNPLSGGDEVVRRATRAQAHI